MMAYWLVKSEPHDWSWDDQMSVESEPWDGVRNFQAQKNMRAMKNGDQVFFYHSGKDREIVGICEVVREAYPDPVDESGKFCLVDLKAVKSVKPISLARIKADESLGHIALVKQSRLSVMPIDDAAWEHLLSMQAGSA
jgi:predicted RNA-binding protein with PUA-like domain